MYSRNLLQTISSCLYSRLLYAFSSKEFCYYCSSSSSYDGPISHDYSSNKLLIKVQESQRALKDLATVITNLASSIPWIGTDLVYLIWGSTSVDDPTLNRFFSLHFLMPFILAALVVMHLIALHQTASNNPEGISSTSDRIRFAPYFIVKDLVGFFWYGIILSIFIFFAPHYLGDPMNSIPANPLVTPPAIVPEWYFCAPFHCLISLENVDLCLILS